MDKKQDIIVRESKEDKSKFIAGHRMNILALESKDLYTMANKHNILNRSFDVDNFIKYKMN